MSNLRVAVRGAASRYRCANSERRKELKSHVTKIVLCDARRNALLEDASKSDRI